VWSNGGFEVTRVNRFLSASSLLVFMMVVAACGGGGDSPSPSSDGTLVSQDLVVGTGATAATGDTVTVNYVGTLVNGTKFDSSYDRGQPFTFRLGAGQVIAGWDQGVVGMRVGGKRRLTIPPSLGYGSQANGPIPANSTLIFEIELLSIAGK
jgi:FKBP-type peptidyl-prolyl cis-trans isomerase FkpA